MTESAHFDDELQDLLDGRVDAATRARIEGHLTLCADCRGRRDALWSVKASVKRALSAGEAPPDLRARIEASLDQEGLAIRSPRTTAWALAAAAAVMIALLLAALLRRPDLPARAAHDFLRFRDGALPLTLKSGDAGTLERLFAEKGIAFPTRVFDLGMMNFRLLGGRIQTMAGRPSALFVYRGPENRLLVCQMYTGRTEELPRDAERVEHGGITFFVYHREGSTQVFWQEGSVTCVLVSDAPSEEVLALSFAKAMRV